MTGKLLFSAAAMTLLVAGCSPATGDAATATGPDGSRTFAATGFTGIELAGSDNVVVRQGAAFSVVATGEAKILDRLEVVVKDGKLIIRRKSQLMGWTSDRGATVTVTLPRLVLAEVSGSGQMDIDRADGDVVEAMLSGSGDLNIGQVTAKTVDVSLAGSGDMTIKGGKADQAVVSLAGSGDINASGLAVTTAEVSLAGSGDVNVTATTSAKVSLAGSGDVRVVGGAKCDSSEIGSGTVSCG